MKKLLVTSLIGLGLVVGAVASDSGSVNVYGVGEKLSDKSYNGVGFQYENDISNIVLEKGSDYSKASSVLKFDINNYFYSKFGIGFLEREILVNGSNKDVTQKTGGVAVGYGNNKNYNLEVGHIVNKLDGALSADGYSRISYIEALGMYQDFDTVGVYKNTKVYNKNYSDYSLDVGYYPIQDLRVSAKYDSVEHDEDNYIARLGVKYTFDSKKWSPFLKASKNSSENILVAIEWSDEIQNKSLNMRDEFENVVSANEIVAQSIAPEIFLSKISEIPMVQTPTAPTPTNSAPTWTASSYDTGLTITDANNNVQIIKDLTAISSDNDGDSITYSIVSISVSNSLEQTIWNNSVYIDNGVLKVHNLQTNNPDFNGNIIVTVKAIATGGSNTTTVSFSFNDVQ
ncbi:MAG: hypothetical protein DRG78_01940 [Epsilonproteobacteria bacterium]|nr:MAG: hypothetical protein DRG78_01940 [Campylobacterota bacterium]